MPLENFRAPKTLESRTPYVLAVGAIFGAIAAAWNWFVGFRYNVEVLLVAAAVALGYVTWRYARRAPPAAGPSLEPDSHGEGRQR